MRYKATHTTRYVYDAPVSQCQSEVRLTPRSLPWQRLIESHITTSPGAASMESHTDYFGNAVTTLTILDSHDRFTTAVTSVVEVEAPPVITSDMSWERARDELAVHAEPDTFDAFEYTFDSSFVPSRPELLEYAAPSFTPGRALLDAVDDLSRRIHDDFRYRPHATSIETPLVDTLKARRGVCQDFAHVMIGGLRSMRLAARYVSGYLRSGADYQGAEASHAWVSAFVPGAGWLDIDPTNAVRPGTGHVTVAWGRDYGDVAPVKGIALGGGNQVVEVIVRVEAL